jgi:hypothetical protein
MVLIMCCGEMPSTLRLVKLPPVYLSQHRADFLPLCGELSCSQIGMSNSEDEVDFDPFCGPL